MAGSRLAGVSLLPAWAVLVRGSSPVWHTAARELAADAARGFGALSPRRALEPQLGLIHERLVGGVGGEVGQDCRGEPSRVLALRREGVRDQRPQPVVGEPRLVRG